MIVEVDPPPDSGPGVVPASESVQEDTLVFEGSPQPLDKDVVEEPALAIHGDTHPGLLQAVRPCPRCELAALVGVEGFWAAIPVQGVIQRIDAELLTCDPISPPI